MSPDRFGGPQGNEGRAPWDHVWSRYSLRPGMVCSRCGDEEVSFDNVDLCKPCWRDDPEWAPGVAHYLPRTARGHLKSLTARLRHYIARDRS